MLQILEAQMSLLQPRHVQQTKVMSIEPEIWM